MASFEAEEGFRIGGRVLRKPSSELVKMPAKPDCKVACACVLATGAMQAIFRLWFHVRGRGASEPLHLARCKPFLVPRAGPLAAGWPPAPLSTAIWRWRRCLGRDRISCNDLRTAKCQVHRQLAVDL